MIASAQSAGVLRCWLGGVTAIPHARRARVTRLLCGLLALGLGGHASAQMAPRLTGDTVISQLDAAQHDLAARANVLHDTRLAATSQRLVQMAEALRKALGSNTAKPIETIDEQTKAMALRGDAAAQRTQMYLTTSSGCMGDDAKAMIEALAVTVDQLAAAANSSKAAQPVINAVETLDHQPLFAIHPDSKPLTLALVGVNLSDPQCADPQITVTDEKGASLDAPPTITGLLPNRIELKWPSGSAFKPGSYVLHVVPKRKAFLVGCTAQPEATAAIQVATPLKFSVSYALSAICGGGSNKPLSMGVMPDITAYGATVSRQVDTSSCVNPVSYAITAKASFGDNSNTSIGPITQSADATITAGMPGGLSLSWDPSVHQLFVRSGANLCKGAH